MEAPTRTIPTSRFPKFANKKDKKKEKKKKKKNARSVLAVALVQVFNCFHADGGHIVRDQPRDQTKGEHRDSQTCCCLVGIREEEAEGEMLEARRRSF